MTITPTNISAYGDSWQSMSRMKYEELHKVGCDNDNGWLIGCINACDDVSCGRMSNSAEVRYDT